MSFIRYKKFGNQEYAYRVTTYWDKERKKIRQKQEYLGKVIDKEEQVFIKPREEKIKPRTALDFGDIILTHTVFCDLNLDKILRDIYSESRAEIIKILTISRILAPQSMRSIRGWYRKTYLTQLCRIDENKLSFQNISRTLANIGDDEHYLNIFFSKWINQSCGKTLDLIYDITSFSTHARLSIAEFGYNHDNDNLPQINLGLVVSKDGQIPLFYKVFPGSIVDVKTIRNLIKDLKSLGREHFLLILDRGFYSKMNIWEMHRSGLDFIIGMPFTTNLSQKIISDTNKFIDNAVQATWPISLLYLSLIHI